MNKNIKKAKRGWYGDSEGHKMAGKKGGMVTAKRGSEYFQRIGQMGGKKRAKS